MAKMMGIYCKAYQLKQLRAFDRWSENRAAARPEGEGDAPRALGDEDVVYVQENYVVTDGIFKDEHVIFDAVDEAWVNFCRGPLQFAIPDDVVRANQAA